MKKWREKRVLKKYFNVGIKNAKVSGQNNL